MWWGRRLTGMGLWGGWSFGARRRVVREVREAKAEVRALRVAVEGIREVLGRMAPEPGVAVESDVDVSYVDTAVQAAFMDIELRLTQARGMPPTEEEVLAEFERRQGVRG